MVRGTYGIYKGEVHRIDFEAGGKISLYPNSESEIDDTYIDEYNIGVYSKVIDPSDLSEAYELKSYAEYKGYKLYIGGEFGDEYALFAPDHETEIKLNFYESNRGEYTLMVKKSDVKVTVEKTPIDLDKIAAHEEVPQTKKPSAKQSSIKRFFRS